MAEIDVTFLAKLAQQNLEESRAIRKELRDVRDLAVTASEYSRRLERRISETRDDLEMTIKVELGGKIVHLQTEMERMLNDRVDPVEAAIKDLQAHGREMDDRMPIVTTDEMT